MTTNDQAEGAARPLAQLPSSAGLAGREENK